MASEGSSDVRVERTERSTKHDGAMQTTDLTDAGRKLSLFERARICNGDDRNGERYDERERFHSKSSECER